MGAGLAQIASGGKPKATKMKPPEPQKVAPMPDEENLQRIAAIEAAKKKGSGRGSTIMSDYDEELG